MENNKEIIKGIIKCLYFSKDLQWVKDFHYENIDSYVIQRWLVHNDFLRVQVRWLDKYVYSLPIKMYLSLAWSIIPKDQRMVMTDNIKIDSPLLDNGEEFEFILKKVRQQFQLADNDYRAIKQNLIKIIKGDMINWFRYYGVEKKFWKKYMLDFNLMKDTNNKGITKGLGAWGIG